MFVLLCTIVVVIVVISLLFHSIFNLIHLFGYPSRKCVIKSVFQCFSVKRPKTVTINGHLNEKSYNYPTAVGRGSHSIIQVDAGVGLLR